MFKSFVYIGYVEERGLAKIGQTTQTPARRAADIRKATHSNYYMLTTKAISEVTDKGTMSIAVEGHMRQRLERAGFERVGNDYFICNKLMLESFTAIAKRVADGYCNYEEIGHEAWR